MQDRDTVRVFAAGAHIKVLAAAVALAAGAAACDMGTETRDPAQSPGADVRPDPQLGTQPQDVDIEERSSEELRAVQNRAATNATDDELGAADDVESAADAGSAQIAALGTRAVSAFAVLEPVGSGNARGDASFIDTEDGLEVVVTMTGLEPGQHGIHVHEMGDCTGPAAEVGGEHFNPDGSQHGAPADDPSSRHAGDFGNISADENGEAQLNLTVDDLTVEGTRGVVGRAIIVHMSEDDFSSQPAGESGDAVSCGVIEARAQG